MPPVDREEKIEYNVASYIRKNRITDNKSIDEKIKKVKKIFPKYLQRYIEQTPVIIVNKKSNSYYLDGKFYFRNDITEDEIVHEIGHLIEDKLDIANDLKYQKILGNNIGDVDITLFGPIKGYDPEKYEFYLKGNNFISDYQRRVYNIDINGKERIDYISYKFNYNIFRDYLPEGLRYYFINKGKLKMENNDLYKYIKEEILNDRKRY